MRAAWRPPSVWGLSSTGQLYAENGAYLLPKQGSHQCHHQGVHPDRCPLPLPEGQGDALHTARVSQNTLAVCQLWVYIITEVQLGQLEQVDKALWCNLLEIARTVPYDLVCLEFGLEPLRYIIMKRRLIYLQHILKQKESSLIRKFLKTQMINLKKKDWGKTIEEDLLHLDIQMTFEDIEQMSKNKYKELIKKKIKEHALQYLVEKKNNRNGKGMKLLHSKLEIQNYLKYEDGEVNNFERKLIFQLRTDMCFKIKTHFRQMHKDTICEGCRKEESTTKHTVECQALLGNNQIVTYIPDYRDLYRNDVEEQAYVARILKDNLTRLPTVLQ